jgi:hypothetical protein
MKTLVKQTLFSVVILLPLFSYGFHIRDAYIFEKVQSKNIVYAELLETKYLDEDKQINSVFDSASNHLNTTYNFSWSKKQLRFKIKEIWKGKNNFKDSFIQFKVNPNVICNSAFFIEEKKIYILFFDSIETIVLRGYFYNDHKIEIHSVQQAIDLKDCIFETIQLMGNKNEIPNDKVHNYIYKYLLNPNTRHWISTEYIHRYKTTHAFNNPFSLSPEEQASIFGSIVSEDSLSYTNYEILNTLTEIDPTVLNNFYIQQLKISKGSMALEIINQLADRNPAPDVQNMKKSIIEKHKDYFDSFSIDYTEVPESFQADIALFIETIAKNRR